MMKSRYLTRIKLSSAIGKTQGSARGISTSRTRLAQSISKIAPTKFRANPKLGVSLLFLGGAATTYFVSDSIQLDTKKNEEGITVEEVKAHNSLKNGVWVVINGEVYDLTEFLATHPGGARVILKYAGQDASLIFNKFHAQDVFKKFLPETAHLGPLIGEMELAPDITDLSDDSDRLDRIQHKPPINKVYNISDFENIAKEILTPNAWAYYSSGSDDEISLRENHYAYQRIFFNPKVLTDVTEIDISTEMLGSKVSAPFYCSAAAQARLGHPEGEVSIAKGCGAENIIQMISSNASNTFDEIVDAANADQPQWFQLYVLPDREFSYQMIDKCKKKGIKGIFVTVDTALIGRREKDLKFRLYDDDEDDDSSSIIKKNDPLLSFKDAGLTWKDIRAFKEATDIPIVVKGVQRVEDVLLAIENKADGVVLSNHGGRQLDFSRAPIEVLADVNAVLKERNLEGKIEIYIDGGIRRGTDILKALCLGAKGVGLGRPFLYANSCYGDKGVRKAIRLLKEELILDMKLLGVSSLNDLTPELLDMRSLHSRTQYPDSLYNKGYVPMAPTKFNDD
ncbi:cytochrome b2, mitochondrial precursor [Scheffersomyces xylosifermentans]|uniref:cytochrome b2, mitochondrial precursor n=1 Tax=Scheffersomyces xylosifermentans TaxID=1304137 RepID=UPI00315CA224